MKIAHSPSAIKMYENCPKRYYHQRITKEVVDSSSPAMEEGLRVHKAFEDRLRSNTPLPKDLDIHEGLCQVVQDSEGELLMEEKFTLNNNLEPTDWFAKDAWLRSIADVLVINGSIATVLDWKTGKPSPDTTQLRILALSIFAHYPNVKTVRAGYVWLKTKGIDNRTYKRSNNSELWQDILSRTTEIQTSFDREKWSPRPSGLCGYCPVKRNLCEYAK